MRDLFKLLVLSVLGAAAGSVVRQKVVHGRSEITVAAAPIPIAAGVVAGLLSPKAKPVVAVVVSLNVASNMDS